MTCIGLGSCAGSPLCVCTANVKPSSGNSTSTAGGSSAWASASASASAGASTAGETTSATQADPTTSSTAEQAALTPTTPTQQPVTSNSCNSCSLSTSGYGDDYAGAHNAIRGAYGLGVLSADGNLEAWVNQAIYQYNSGSRDCGNNGHDGSAAVKGMGENFWVGMGQDSAYRNRVSMAAAVDSWNQEAGNYFAWSGRRSNPNDAWAYATSIGQEVGHFTQIVWSSTTRVGCARRLCMSSGQFPYVVMIGCRYQAIGNMFGSSGLENPFYS
ncbi:CAP domain-containing protein [Zopfochytrium polystomum]|nr:CAP domain-containing protein [Zopfochytrium polystomum]